ncbi:MAG TPA: tripartite tricarboxylate transporter substrate-binding protein, partial [Ramlibacter sp.]|nr:tripartite tricarboxylate transporter substrate-binding protein [Ramlibacter sp.]
VVENRPGAGGNIGTGAVAKAPADGYTWGMIGNSFAVNPSLYRSMPFRQADLLPVAIVATSPFIVVASNTAPFQTVPELVRHARSRPGEVMYASGGSGTIGHLGSHWLADLAGVKLQHVPYKGAAPAIADLVAGHVHLYFDTLTSSAPFIKAGQVRPLFITTTRRMREWPQVQTAAEAGFPALARSAWIGIVLPAATPGSVAERINQEVNKALASERFRARLAALGASGIGGTLSDTRRFIEDETERWASVVRASGAQAE